MRFLHDGKTSHSELLVLGMPSEWLDLGRVLSKGLSIEHRIEGTTGPDPDPHYPYTLKGMNLTPEPEDKAFMTILLESERLVIRGGNDAFRQLGNKFLRVFSGKVMDGYHVHVDEYNPDVNPTPYSLSLQATVAQ